MAKRGLFIGNIGPFLRAKIKKGGWALCIGAGTSLPMFPNWTKLVYRLVARDVGKDRAKELSQRLLNSYSPDALIQAAYDRMVFDSVEFIEILSTELYRDIRNSLNRSDWDLFTRMISARLGEYRRSKWLDYLVLIRESFPRVTALQIAEVIADYIGTELSPSAILSFNAEPLFASLVNTYIRVDKVTLREAQKNNKQKFDLITHSITNRHINRVPYYFIHGLLPVPSDVKKRRIIASVDKLVFSESDYLQLANNSFSWQSSVFLNVCNSRSVVFIGVSLSDPNMRRWLSWTHMNRKNELEFQRGFRGTSTSHYWISKHPGSADERRWIESSVEHLGVRLVWVNEWNEIGEVLRSMLEVSV